MILIDEFPNNGDEREKPCAGEHNYWCRTKSVLCCIASECTATLWDRDVNAETNSASFL